MAATLLPWALALPLAAQASWTPASTTFTDALAAESLSNQLNLLSNGTLNTILATEGVSQTCNNETAAVRKGFTTLTTDERIAFTTAIKCLMDAPALTPSVSQQFNMHYHRGNLNHPDTDTLISLQEAAPGVKSRYDDFVGTHVNQTE